MTTKSEIHAKIAELQALADSLPDDKPAVPVNPVFVPKCGDAYTYLGQDYGIFTARSMNMAAQNLTAACFRTEEVAQAEAEALNTFYALRAHPNRVPSLNREFQETILHTADWSIVVSCQDWIVNKPWGAYTDAAQVIADIGADHIERMIKTLAWVG